MFRFYEWKKDGSRKQPYYIYFKDGRPLVFAALFDSWKSSEGDTLSYMIFFSDGNFAWLDSVMLVPIYFN